ncbi:MAG: ATP-binding protein [Kiritimatiellae bacterium]|jgi:signal transduction histidine kinase|nr:ATP-binding protein [Kiritimatiellia bacterium]
MKLWMKLFLSLLVVAVLPTWFLSRYARSTFHHFSKQGQEEQMAQAAHLLGELFRSVSADDERERVLTAHAERAGRRLRYFDPEGRLLFDVGDVGEIDVGENPDVQKVLDTRRYAARWWLKPDHSRLYYFSSVPVLDDSGEFVGVAQVVEHTGRITSALIRLNAYQQTGLMWVSIGTVGLAIIFSMLLTRKLRRLRQAAQDFARGGEVKGFQMAGRDEVAQLAQGFQEMAEELQVRQAYNREFVQTTLHELKTPLTAMHGAADILYSRGELSAVDRKRFAGNIQVQSDRLLRLVEDLQTLTSLDMELPRERLEATAVGPFVAEVVQRIRPALSHEVEVISRDVERMVSLVPARIEQALINLLHNADRYQCGKNPIRVRVKDVEEKVEFAVEDDGPGITETDPLRIFERYFSTVPRDQCREYGQGLGLAVVKRIVEHHHGDVLAENPPSGGARIGFRL